MQPIPYDLFSKNELRAYMAGLFDGEGWIVISRSYRLQVGMDLTVTEPLALFHREFGGSLIECKETREHMAYKKRRWRWFVTSNNAALFLEKMHYSFRVKQIEAVIGFLFQDVVRQRKRRGHFTSEERSLRELFRVECSLIKWFNL